MSKLLKIIALVLPLVLFGCKPKKYTTTQQSGNTTVVLTEEKSLFDKKNYILEIDNGDSTRYTDLGADSTLDFLMHYKTQETHASSTEVQTQYLTLLSKF